MTHFKILHPLKYLWNGSPSGRGQGIAIHFCILDIVNFARVPVCRRRIGVVKKLADGQLVDYTYDV